jgi:hypothetical protein
LPKNFHRLWANIYINDKEKGIAFNSAKGERWNLLIISQNF